ncbi:hypothetical protein D3C85_274350 [compost metagenome]
MLNQNKLYRPYWRLYEAAQRVAMGFSVRNIAFSHGMASALAIEVSEGEELDRYLNLVNTLADQRYKEIGYE